MTTNALMELAPCICGAVVDQDECPYPAGPHRDEKCRALFKVTCTNPECGWQAIGWGADGARKAWNTRPALRIAAAEGGEAVAFIDPQAVQNFKSRACTKEWMWRDNDVGLVPVYLHPPTDSDSDSGAGRDGERLDFLIRESARVQEYNGDALGYRVEWPDLGCHQLTWSETARAAIDTAIAGAAGE